MKTMSVILAMLLCVATVTALPTPTPKPEITPGERVFIDVPSVIIVPDTDEAQGPIERKDAVPLPTPTPEPESHGSGSRDRYTHRYVLSSQYLHVKHVTDIYGVQWVCFVDYDSCASVVG